MAYEKIVAAYDNVGKAKEAARALEASGFSSADISLLNRDTLSASEVREEGIWRRLFGRNVADNESVVYSRTIESGGALLTVRARDAEVPRAMKILDVHTPVDVGDRTKTAVVPPVGTVRTPVGEEVLRLAEEQLEVGKRVVETGKARIRRFIVEKPVESQVTLHEEHVAMIRRPVNDRGVLKDVDWADKTFEITETAEQAVITKSAHVAEEVVIRVEGSDHVETVRDTIRRQQVELERTALNRDTKLDRDIKKAA